MRRIFPASLTAWIACLAILLASLVPVLSQTLRGADLLEICTAAGAKWVDAGTSDDAPAPTKNAGHPYDHCPYCALQAGTADLPPVAALAPYVPVLRFELPRLFLKAARTLFAWAPTQARAPPARA